MAFELGSRAAESGYRLAAYETIGSTNSEALARARAGDPGRLWIVSAHQSAGRGRRGRSWQTPAGNLAASLLLVDRQAAAFSPALGFVAGLAVVSAIEGKASQSAGAGVLRPLSPCGRGWPSASAEGRERGSGAAGVTSPSPAPRASARGTLPRKGGGSWPDVDLRLKWPNDVLLGGAKVAGILLEATTLAGGAGALAVGIGVNVVHAPAGLPYPATSLAGAGFMTTAETLLAALSDAWVEEQARSDGGRGFAEVRRRWLAAAAGVGEPIAVAEANRTIRGMFETIDNEGRLLIRTSAGATHVISAGDVYFSAAATEA